MHPLELLRQLVDPQRLAVIGALARRPYSSAELADQLDRPVEDVLRVLAPFVQAGLAAAVDGTYHLDVAAWSAVGRDLPTDPDANPRVAFGMTADEAQTLARFFSGDRLIELPAQRSSRLIVLERLALEFEPGVRYDEREVTELLRRFHDDYTTLRRALVDEGYLDRAAGEYWRAGGRVL